MPLPVSDTPIADPRQQLRAAQVASFVLAVAVLLAAIVVGGMVLGGHRSRPPGSVALFGPLLGVMGIGQIVVYVLLRSAHLKQTRSAWLASAQDAATAAQIASRFAILAIIRAALFEGWGLLGVVACLSTAELGLLFAPAGAALGILMTFPTTARFSAFLAKATRGQATESGAASAYNPREN